MNNLSLRLPEDVQRDLDAEAKLRHCKRSELAREVIVEFLKRSKRERFMAEFVAEARTLAKNPEARREALEIAEEDIPLGNEVVDIAEGRKPGDPWPEEQGERWWEE